MVLHRIDVGVDNPGMTWIINTTMDAGGVDNVEMTQYHVIWSYTRWERCNIIQWKDAKHGVQTSSPQTYSKECQRVPST